MAHSVRMSGRKRSIPFFQRIRPLVLTTTRYQRVGHVEEGGADENQACAACEDCRDDFGSDEHLLTYVIPTTATHNRDTQELSEHRGQIASRIDEIRQDDIKRLPLMLGLRPDPQGLHRWRRTQGVLHETIVQG